MNVILFIVIFIIYIVVIYFNVIYGMILWIVGLCLFYIKNYVYFILKIVWEFLVLCMFFFFVDRDIEKCWVRFMLKRIVCWIWMMC